MLYLEFKYLHFRQFLFCTGDKKMLNNQLKYIFSEVTSGMRQTSRREEDNILCVWIKLKCVKL